MLTKLFTLAILLYAAAINAQSTKINIYQAYIDNKVLNPNLVVAQRYEGECVVRSYANPGRMDAWRCRASNMILDPCFEDGEGLACISSPWTHRASILELNTPLYDGKIRKIVSHSQPWAIELETGVQCTFLAGTSLVVHKQRINYGCNHYNYVIGKIDQSSPNWKASVYNAKDKTVHQTTITAAWF